MNIPPDRRILTGRTFRQSWSATDYDPIEGPTRKTSDRICWLAVAVVALWVIAVIVRHGWGPL